MNKRAIDRFFQKLSREFRVPCKVILTGAGAGIIYGRVRATLDLDFAVKIKTTSVRKKDQAWQLFETCARKVSRETGIAVQYAEDIDRWSTITFMDYEKHARSYRRFGSLEIRLMHPVYWSIGKFMRYLDPDIQDLVEVLRKNRIPVRKLTQTLGKALRQSPKSTDCALFRRQVEDFLSTYGRKIWGRGFDAKAAILSFRKAARISP